MGNGRTLGVGLIGLGVVGTGVVQLIQKNREDFKKFRGVDLDLRRVAVRDPGKPREVDLPTGAFTTAEALVEDPDVDIVVEVMGGVDAATDLCCRALKSGKDLVTANKAMMAERGDEVFSAAAAGGASVGFEASVCGGIPILQALRDGLVANQVESLYGILNGTTNYILTRMTDEGGSFDEMLQEAQDAGYAEADPAMDIDGTDAAQKLSLLCRIAFRRRLDPEHISKEGIEGISPVDIDFARELGYTIKLLGIARPLGDSIEARVHPALVPLDSQLANIKHEFNAVEVVGSAAGPQVFTGRGAGRLPTASAIVADLVDVAQRRLAGRGESADLARLPEAAPASPDSVKISAYCRFTVFDTPGVLAQIACIFADHNIGIAKVIQHGRSESEGDTVTLIMTTHEARESDMKRAVHVIGQLPVVQHEPKVIRIEEL
jgi:homoserine dehydrogenase